MMAMYIVRSDSKLAPAALLPARYQIVFHAIRSVLCGALCVTAAMSAAAELDLVSVKEIKAGEVVARVQYSGTGQLHPTAIILQLDSAQKLQAGEVVPVVQGRPSMAVLICLDRSGSMGPKAVAEVQAALKQALAPRDAHNHLPFSVSIVAFATRSNHLLGFTSNPADIAPAIDRLTLDKERLGRTKLHDTLAGGLAELRATDAASKRLIVISDGKDEGSDISQGALIERAQADPSITVNAVGFGALKESYSGSIAALAGATNGRFAIASSEATLASVIVQMIRQAVDAPQYDVTFHYAPDKDQRRAETAVLLYRPQAGHEARLAVNESLAAVVMSNNPLADSTPPITAAETAMGSRDTTATKGSTQDSGWIDRFVHGIPLLGWIAAGILLLLVLLILLLRSRKPLETQPSPQPPISSTKIRPPTLPPLVAAEPSRTPVSRNTLVAFRWPNPGEGHVVAILTSLAGAAPGSQFPMTKAKLQIGAALDNDLVLKGDDFVSGHHVILNAEANSLYVVDLGSRNGTALNGSVFKDMAKSLLPGDQITLGRTLLEISSVDVPSQHGDPTFETRVP